MDVLQEPGAPTITNVLLNDSSASRRSSLDKTNSESSSLYPTKNVHFKNKIISDIPPDFANALTNILKSSLTFKITNGKSNYIKMHSTYGGSKKNDGKEKSTTYRFILIIKWALTVNRKFTKNRNCL